MKCSFNICPKILFETFEQALYTQKELKSFRTLENDFLKVEKLVTNTTKYCWSLHEISLAFFLLIILNAPDLAEIFLRTHFIHSKYNQDTFTKPKVLSFLKFSFFTND